MPLHTFTGVSRVRVVDASSPIVGKTGFIVRRRHGNAAAWIRMDDDVPAELRSFEPPDRRARDVVLFPDDCEPLV